MDSAGQLGQNSVGWLRSEVDAWLGARAAERTITIHQGD